jgi:hypothetical protein
MKKQVFEQVRPPGTYDVGEWLLADAEGPDADDLPAAFGVRWTIRLDDWYLTPAAGFIPLTRVVH